MTSEAKAAAEQVIADYILPLPSSSTSSASTSKNVDIDEVAWTDHLLNTMQHLDDLGVNTILSMSGIKAKCVDRFIQCAANIDIGCSRPTMYEHYLQASIQNNVSPWWMSVQVFLIRVLGWCHRRKRRVNHTTSKQRGQTLVSYVIVRVLFNVLIPVPGQFPDPVKAAEDLHEFAKANENRLYRLLKTCVDPQSDLKSIVKASGEFLRRVEQSHESILSTMTIFLRRATLRIVNQSSISTLIKKVQKSAPPSKHAQQLLTFISKHCPILYKPHVSELTKAIADEGNVILVEVGMHALAAVTKVDESQAVDKYVSFSLPCGGSLTAPKTNTRTHSAICTR